LALRFFEGVILMCRALFAVMSMLAVVANVGSISSAAARNYRYSLPPPVQDRYCLQGRIWGYPGNCQFSTYDQCMATASGTNAYCGINPAYAFAHPQWRYY